MEGAWRGSLTRALCTVTVALTAACGATACGEDGGDSPASADGGSRAQSPEQAAARTLPEIDAGGPGAPVATRDPLHRFAPEVHLHSGEELRPARALALGDPREPDARVVRRRGQATVTPTPTYIELRRTAAAGERRLRIAYWQLYDSEVRDWERISVLLRLAGSGRYVPLSVRYHHGTRSHDVPWTATERVAAPGEAPATHPVVYAGLDSRLPLWRPGRYRGLDGPGSVVEAKACADCPRWRTWEWVRRHQEDTLASRAAAR